MNKTLEDLLFKAEDFDSFNIRHIDAATGKPLGIDGSHELLEVANYILREKLEKAPVVYGNPDYTEWNGTPDNGHWRDTHTARLVCIEKIS